MDVTAKNESTKKELAQVNNKEEKRVKRRKKDNNKRLWAIDKTEWLTDILIKAHPETDKNIVILNQRVNSGLEHDFHSCLTGKKMVVVI